MGADPASYVHQLNNRAHSLRCVPVWAVYDHPTDYPDHFIARMHVARQDGTSSPTMNALRTERLETIQNIMRRAGLTRLPRGEDDDAKIVETWI